MKKLQLSLAVGNYAITLPLTDGTVEPEGIELTPLVLPSPERHWRMLRNREFDISETSMAGYLRAVEEDPDALTAIPVFPHRRFRHGYIFVADPALAGHPEQLNGARIGLRTWGTSAGVWLRGILQDEHGVELTSVSWVTESAEHVPGGRFEHFDIRPAPSGRGLVDLLLNGELDALIYPEVPVAPRGSSRTIQRLFPTPRDEEQSYFARTGVFPIMHTVTIRRSIAEQHPWVPVTMMAAFETAKRLAYQRLRDPRWVPLAWVETTLEEQDQILGDDPWPNGFDANAQNLETLIRYAHEQGLIAESRDARGYFWPATLAKPPVYRAAGRR